MSTAPKNRISLIHALLLSMAPVLFLAGCGPKQAGNASLSGLGQDLREVAKTKGTHLEYKADRAGKLYLYDYDTGQFLFSAPVNADETFILEPASNRALLGKDPVELDYPANAFDDYRLYLADK
jgi:hypothetical protein